MGIEKIVLAYDGSKSSEKALEWAVALANQIKGEIVVVAVVRPPEFSPSIDEVDEFYADGKKQYLPLLDKVLTYGVEHSITIQTQVLYGHPAESIVRYAADATADLIVVGTRGMGGFKSLLIGSIAQKVVTYSKIPVVVVK